MTEIADYLIQLSDSLLQLQHDGVLCDVLIEARNGTIVAHSAVLAAASEHIRDLFIKQSQAEVSSVNRSARSRYTLPLKNCSVVAVTSILRAIYSHSECTIICDRECLTALVDMGFEVPDNIEMAEVSIGGITSLTETLQQMSSEGVLCDVTIQAADGLLTAHSAVLAAASTALRDQLCDEQLSHMFSIDLSGFLLRDVSRSVLSMYSGIIMDCTTESDVESYNNLNLLGLGIASLGVMEERIDMKLTSNSSGADVRSNVKNEFLMEGVEDSESATMSYSVTEVYEDYSQEQEAEHDSLMDEGQGCDSERVMHGVQYSSALALDNVDTSEACNIVASAEMQDSLTTDDQSDVLYLIEDAEETVPCEVNSEQSVRVSRGKSLPQRHVKSFKSVVSEALDGASVAQEIPGQSLLKCGAQHYSTHNSSTVTVIDFQQIKAAQKLVSPPHKPTVRKSAVSKTSAVVTHNRESLLKPILPAVREQENPRSLLKFPVVSGSSLLPVQSPSSVKRVMSQIVVSHVNEPKSTTSDSVALVVEENQTVSNEKSKNSNVSSHAKNSNNTSVINSKSLVTKHEPGDEVLEDEEDIGKGETSGRMDNESKFSSFLIKSSDSPASSKTRPLESHDSSMKLKYKRAVECEDDEDEELMGEEPEGEESVMREESILEEVEPDVVLMMIDIQSEPNSRCVLCDEQFSSTDDLSRHIADHHHCNKCNKYFRSSDGLHRHTQIEHSNDEKPFPCLICTECFTSAHQLTEHRKTHQILSQPTKKDFKQYMCADCKTMFYRLADLRSHRKLEHLQDEGHVCNICNKTLSSSNALAKHMDSHASEKSFTCHLCGTGFKQNLTLARHLRSTHNLCSECGEEGEESCSCEPSSKNGKNVCEVCSKACSSARHLEIHLRSHTGEKPETCKECGLSFQHKSNLLKHQMKHTVGKTFTCDFCSRSFYTNHSLQSHMRKHTGDSPFQCETCGKRFCTKNGLQVHTVLHTDNRPFTCGTCGKSFAQLGNLNKHLAIHTGARPFKCGYCPMAFVDTSALRRHAVQHTRQRNFVCPICDRSFLYLTSLRAHKLTHEDLQVYGCSQCSKTFRQKIGLQRHMKTHEKKHGKELLLDNGDIIVYLAE